MRIKITKSVIGTLIFLISIGSWSLVIAEDKPEEILKPTEPEVQEKIEQVSLEQRWQAFLDSKDWGSGAYEGGVIIFPDRDIIVSSATEFTKVNVGQPGWVESRVVAFENAEMEAKSKIIRYLAETAETERSLNYFEKASWSDGSIEEAKTMGEIQETLNRIGKKSLALSEAALDKALRELDEDYDPEKYKNKNPEELKTIVEDKFNRRIKTMAFSPYLTHRDQF